MIVNIHQRREATEAREASTLRNNHIHPFCPNNRQITTISIQNPHLHQHTRLIPISVHTGDLARRETGHQHQRHFDLLPRRGEIR